MIADGLTGAMEQNAVVNGVFMENLIVDGAHGATTAST